MGFEFVTSLTGVMRHSTAMVGVVVLGACAGTGDGQKVDEHVNPKLSAETFTTKGKPTKTIETPWGPREIIDHSRVPQIVTASKLYLGFKSQGQTEKAWENWQIVEQAIEAEELDFLRIGCVSTIGYRCVWNTNYFSQDCGESHNFGSQHLSDCEKQFSIDVFRRAERREQCTISGNLVFVDLHKPYKSEAQLFEDIFTTECKVWRGQTNWKLNLTKENYFSEEH